MKTKQQIEIEGLPEGFRAVVIDMTEGSHYLLEEVPYCFARVELEKIKPRRIVLEETEQDNTIWPEQIFKFNQDDTRVSIFSGKIWREVGDKNDKSNYEE